MAFCHQLPVIFTVICLKYYFIWILCIHFTSEICRLPQIDVRNTKIFNLQTY